MKLLGSVVTKIRRTILYNAIEELRPKTGRTFALYLALSFSRWSAGRLRKCQTWQDRPWQSFCLRSHRLQKASTFFQQAFRDALRYYMLPCALLFNAFVNPVSQKISDCTLYKHIHTPSCGLELFCLPRRLVINTTRLYPYASATPISYLRLTPMPIFIFEPHTILRVTKTVGIAPEILDLFVKPAFASLRVNDP